MSASTWENIELKLPNRTFSENINFLFALHKRVFSGCTAQRGMCYVCSVNKGQGASSFDVDERKCMVGFLTQFWQFTALLRSLLCISAATGVGTTNNSYDIGIVCRQVA